MPSYDFSAGTAFQSTFSEPPEYYTRKGRLKGFTLAQRNPKASKPSMTGVDMFKNILVPIDFSDNSMRLVPLAKHLA